jgi:hypothetical protein
MCVRWRGDPAPFFVLPIELAALSARMNPRNVEPLTAFTSSTPKVAVSDGRLLARDRCSDAHQRHCHDGENHLHGDQAVERGQGRKRGKPPTPNRIAAQPKAGRSRTIGVGGAPTMRLTDSTQGSGMLRCPHGSPPLSHRARRPRVVACARARRKPHLLGTGWLEAGDDGIRHESGAVLSAAGSW